MQPQPGLQNSIPELNVKVGKSYCFEKVVLLLACASHITTSLKPTNGDGTPICQENQTVAQYEILKPNLKYLKPEDWKD